MDAIEVGRATPAGTRPPPALRVRGARLTFGDVRLFDGLDLDLAAGSTTCLLGPSGVGKSSLLRLIAGLAPPGTTGTVEADDGAPLAGRVAWMDQQDLLMPWAGALDNVLLGQRLRGVARPDVARALQLLEAVGLGGSAEARPATLSGGMRSRVALARTLMEDRPIVLMDEPFGALDPVTRYRLQNLAGRLLAGRTVLLVTHDPLEALRLGGTVLVMSGRPARLAAVPAPTGPAPRDVEDPGLAEVHGHLLAALARADGGAA